MASYSKITIAATVLLLALIPAHSATAAAVKAGDKCSPVGATFKQGTTNFQCVKQGSGGVWKAEAKAAVETFIMPKVTGMNLQLAQDLLQSKGSYLMDQQDAAGLNRWQIIDSAWKVCSQSPSAGKKVPTSTMVVLKNVKLTENCP
jgi:hypothetical protein